MNADELRRLIDLDEGHRVEFKSSLQPDAFEALCAFLNAEGGHVLIGVRNDRGIIGYDVGKNTKENIPAEVERNIDPTPYITVEVVPVDGRTVIVLTAAGRRPGIVYFAKGKAHVRVGATTRLLTAAEIKARHLEGQPTGQPLPNDWHLEENAPEFYLRPGVDNGKDKGPNRLLMSITIEGADVKPSFRWQGEGVTDEWLELTRDQPMTQRKYSVRGGTVFEHPALEGTLAFEAQFRWKNAECHALWEFPYHINLKYTWQNLQLDTTPENLRPREYWRVLE